jgi:hypothetical protein
VAGSRSLNRVKKSLALGVGTLLALALGMLAGGSPAGAASGFTCAGGPIPAGTYSSVTVTGFCAIQGHVEIRGGLTIAANSGLDAVGQNCDAFLDVSGGVRVQENGILFLGNSQGTSDQQNNPCPSSNDVVRGGLNGVGALAVVVHGTTISGGFSLSGGGGGTSCENVPGLPFPPFSDVEDSHINGGASMSGLSTCWMGFIRNQVNGGVHVNTNTMGDPDAIEIGLNSIHGGLACSGNQLDPSIPGPGGVPTNSFDGSPPNPNTIRGQATGQCAGL